MQGYPLWIVSAISVGVISLISLIGVFLLIKNERLFHRAKDYLVALAIGALLGDSFLHLIPESVEQIAPSTSANSFLTGFGLFLLFERYLHWQHRHLPHERRGALPVGKLNLLSDGIHNFVDGIIIGASFLVSLPIGLSTALSVVLHEIPQELGDYAILVKSGYSKKKALLFNFISALLAVVGLILSLLTLGKIADSTPWLLGFTAGGFVFMSFILGQDLFNKQKQSLALVVWGAIGFVIMSALTFLK